MSVVLKANAARDALILAHRDLVTQIAVRMRRRLHPSASLTIEDLRSAGMIGLIEAAAAFKPARGVPFGAFAQHRIRGAMVDDLRASDLFGRRARRLNKAVLVEEENLRHALGREPERAEVAARLGIPERQLDQAHRLYDRAMDIDALADVLPAAMDVESDVMVRDERRRLAALVDALPPRDRDILHWHYNGEWSLVDVAGRMGISPSRASQLHASAVRRLRRAMGVPEPPPVGRNGQSRSGILDFTTLRKKDGVAASNCLRSDSGDPV